MRSVTSLRPLPIICLLVLFSTVALGAESIVDNDISSFIGAARKNVVKNATGKLYCAFVDDALPADRPVRLASSVNSGSSWAPETFVFNDATSGLSGSSLATGCAMAIDSAGKLHVIWGRYYYPSFYEQYYRWYDPAAMTSSAIVNMTAVVNATNSTRSDAMEITCDASDYVWITTQGASSWKDGLVRSSQPLNITPGFNILGSISSDSYSAQDAQIAVDTMGRIRCTFYNNTPPGVVCHRYYDSVTSAWGGPNVTIGDTTGGHDRYTQVEADALGNVHCLFMREALIAPVLEYLMWSNGSWGVNIPIVSITATQLAGNSSAMHTLAVEESTGKAWAVFRDLTSAGEFVVYEKALTATSFSHLRDLQPATTGKNEYIYPTARGALYPAFNNTGTLAGGTIRRGTASPFQLVYLDWLSDPAGKIYGSGCPGSGAFTPALTLGTTSNPVPGGSLAFEITNGLGGAKMFMFFGATEAALPMGAGCTLNITPLLPPVIVLPLGGSGPGLGVATLAGPLPGAYSNYSFTTQIFVVDPGGAIGFSNSNGLKVTIP